MARAGSTNVRILKAAGGNYSVDWLLHGDFFADAIFHCTEKGPVFTETSALAHQLGIPRRVRKQVKAFCSGSRGLGGRRSRYGR